MGDVRCKDCVNFERGKWHKEFGGEDQLSGKCKLLAAVLKMENITIFNTKELNVQDTFGCSVGTKKVDL